MQKPAISGDIIEPGLAIKVARQTLADFEVNNEESLAAYLPSKEVMDVEYEIDYQDEIRTTAANWRAFEGNATSDTWGSGAKAVGSLMPISRIHTISEEQKIRMRWDANEALTHKAVDLVRNASKSIALQVNLQRANAIFNGRVDIKGSGGLDLTVDFGRKPEFSPTATKLFSDPTADPIEQLMLWNDQYHDTNHKYAYEVWMPKPVWRQFLRHPKVVSAVNPAYARESQYANKRAIDELLDSLSLPPVIIKAPAKVQVDDLTTGKHKLVDIMPQDKLFFMPKPGNAGVSEVEGDYGVTLWGQSASAELAGISGVSGEFGTPGIVAGWQRTSDFPYSAQIFADALAMPVVVRPNAVLSGKVL